jgi:uncharacterized protein YlxW (UPF0749 family)
MHMSIEQKLIAYTFAVVLTMTGFAATAVDTGVYNNLNRSRDALLNQRAHLQEVADNLKRRMDDTQRQLDSVNAYLRDTDNAIRDVDNALRRY